MKIVIDSTELMDIVGDWVFKHHHTKILGITKKEQVYICWDDDNEDSLAIFKREEE